jgi:hypothetical protein
MSGQGTRTAPAGRLTAKRLMDSLYTKLSAGTNTNLDADRTTGAMTTSTVTRPAPDLIELRLPDGTKYALKLERI